MKDKPDSSATDNQAEEKDGTSRAVGSSGAFFEIHVQGHLNCKWSDWFEGMELVPLENGETVLAGHIVDQAALMGILNKLNRLNLNLVSINKQAED
jgi:hypothetical protein